MTTTPIRVRAISASIAFALTAGILAVAHYATYTGEAGLPVVQLERVVVSPTPGQLAEASARRVN
ncbi:MAG: hypothetical protein LW847_08900 [Burkholderiales bacterium]|jgi:hypothetical protein|nr:hypothetical protein [Burkholderiales bacterium]